MAEERQEVYERIPWETLEKRGGDRQWLLIAVAGAVAVGALAYSFMQNRPVPAAQPVAESVVPTAPVATIESNMGPPSTVAGPMVAAEADLYAVDPVRLSGMAAAHAEWFAVEYVSVDGSEQSLAALQALMPAALPPPEVPEGTQVFVDWVGTSAVTETGPLTFEVEVVVRSLMARGDEGFVRQPVRTVTVEVVIAEDGQPRVARPPSISTPTFAVQAPMTLSPLPADLQTQIETTHGPVVGGEQLADGRWRVVVMALGIDGVRRPTTLIAP